MAAKKKDENKYVVVKGGLHMGSGKGRATEVPIGTEITLTPEQAASRVGKVVPKGEYGKPAAGAELNDARRQVATLTQQVEQLTAENEALKAAADKRNLHYAPSEFML